MALQDKVSEARQRSRSREPDIEAGVIPPYNANQDAVIPPPPVDPFSGERETSSGAKIISQKPDKSKVVKESTTRYEWVALIVQLLLTLSFFIGYIVTGIKDMDGKSMNEDMSRTLLQLGMLSIGVSGSNGVNMIIARFMYSKAKNLFRKNGLIAPE